MSKLVLIMVICLVIECSYSQFMPYRRIKRGKYYANQPQRFYNRPPYPMPVSGIFSYTPPPNFKEEEPSYPGSRPKVSSNNPSAPNSDGLGDEDINNLVKYLTKQDLDKIIQYAKNKERDNDPNSNEVMSNPDKSNEFRPSPNDFKEQTKDPYEKFNFKDQYKTETPAGVYNKYSNEYNKQLNHNDDSQFRPIFPDSDYKSQISNYDQKPEFNSYVTQPTSPRYPDYNNPDSNNIKYLGNSQQDNNQRYTEPNNYQYGNSVPYPGSINANQDYITNNNRYDQSTVSQNTVGTPLYSNPYSEVSSQEQFKFGNSLQYSNSYNNQNDFQSTEREQSLPKPTNLRDETEYELSYTNKVASVTNAESSTYKVEDFGDLPLMDYNSKLASSDSYNVPHYTVTSPSSYSEPAPSLSLISSSSYGTLPMVEPAPPISAARQQSDAHLKAVQIWTNKSKGTAYTLHDDGTLTLERPLRPRPSYGSYGH